ncbi:PaaI family thioesterase [Streptococcus sp. zg-JUN1979]|uniref:PaaI family thioesterase n=1 Tax=Streptococcus sp. zg-JUN1979 TaxID=3391450 RepID=UPI0039A49CEF
MEELLIDKISVFENYSLKHYDKGYVELETEVVPSSLNHYGNAHGGYLFTLCDQVGSLAVLSLGYHAVTMSAAINYLKAGHLGERLCISGRCLHEGRTTKVVEVSVHSMAKELLAKATFTMFVTGSVVVD